MDKLVVSPREAARALDVSNSKAYELIENGMLPAYRMGNGWKVSVAGLEKFVIDRANAEAKERRNKWKETSQR